MDYDLSNDTFDESGDVAIDLANQAIFDNAATFWENTITGYGDGDSRTLTVHVSAFQQAASGGSVLLGSAGPKFTTEVTVGVDNFLMTTTGQLVLIHMSTL